MTKKERVEKIATAVLAGFASRVNLNPDIDRDDAEEIGEYAAMEATGWAIALATWLDESEAEGVFNDEELVFGNPTGEK